MNFMPAPYRRRPFLSDLKSINAINIASRIATIYKYVKNESNMEWRNVSESMDARIIQRLANGHGQAVINK